MVTIVTFDIKVSKEILPFVKVNAEFKMHNAK